MKNVTDDYTIETIEDNNSAVISGILRLQSPTAYEKPFEQIIKEIEKSNEDYLIDIQKLTFLNSSGVSSLARIVLLARQKDISLKLICDENIPWQKKTIISLTKLHPKLTVDFS